MSAEPTGRGREHAEASDLVWRAGSSDAASSERMKPEQRHERLARTLDATGVGRLLRRIGPWPGVLVLNYHRVAGPDTLLFDPDAVNATAHGFDAHLATLVRETEVIDPTSLRGALGRRRGRRVMLTFDDGYRDNHDVVLPLLRRHGVTATFFLATGFLDRPRLPWWDEIAWMMRSHPAAAAREEIRRCGSTFGAESYLDRLAESLGSGRAGPAHADGLWMTWEMVRALRDAGMTIGGHTVDHPWLARLTPAAQEAQVGQCAARLETELGLPMRTFSYPFGLPGSFDQVTRAALEHAAVELAFNFSGGIATRRGFDRLDVPRASVRLSTTPRRLRAALTLPGRHVWP